MIFTGAAIGVDMNTFRGYRRGPAPLRKAGGVRVIKEGSSGKKGGGLGYLVATDSPSQQKKNGARARAETHDEMRSLWLPSSPYVYVIYLCVLPKATSTVRTQLEDQCSQLLPVVS